MESNNIVDNQVRKQGFWNFTQFYNTAFEWLNDKGYYVFEPRYSEKIKEGGKKVDIDWYCYRDVTDDFRFEFVINYDITGMNDATIEKNGKKLKSNKGDLKFNIKANLISDYNYKWEKKPFLQFLRRVYKNFILRTTTEEYKLTIYKEANEYIAFLKSFLEV